MIISRRSLPLLFGCVLLIVSGCCRRTPTLDQDGGVRLVYEIDRERMAEVEDDPDWSPQLHNLPELRAALARRLDAFPGTTIEPAGESSLEIVIPRVSEDDRDHIQALITRWGHLEFLIVANHEDHADMIAHAVDDGAQDDDVVVDGQMVGRWVHVGLDDAQRGQAAEYSAVDGRDILRAQRDDDTYERVEIPEKVAHDILRRETTLRDWLTQQGYRDLQVLVAVEDPNLNVSGRYLRWVEMGHDEALMPSLLFTLSDHGAKRMERLTSENLPDPSRDFYRRLGIIFDDKIVSAPRLMSVIGREGQITGNFTEEEVEVLVAVLRAGRLPVVLKPEPVSEEWIEPK